MTSYIIRRLLLMLPTLIGIMTLCFLISEFVPGGPIDQVRAVLEGRGPGSGGREAGGSSGGGNRGASEAKSKKINPKDEMRLLRQYGYHTTRLERYLRTILWYSPDSVITSKETDVGEGAYFLSHGRKHIVVRLPDLPMTQAGGLAVIQPAQYYAFEASPRSGNGKEVAYDKAAGVLRDTLNENIFYDVRTGHLLSGNGPGLEPVPLKLRGALRVTTHELAYDATGATKNLLADSLLQEAYEKTGQTRPPCISADSAPEVVIVTLPNQTLIHRYFPARKRLDICDQYAEAYVHEPLWRSLANWENWHGYFLLKFGNSIHYNRPAYDLIAERLPVSMRLGILSFFITYIGCITLGISKAVRNGTAFDSWSSAVVLVGYSIPGFVLAVVLLALFGEIESSWIQVFPSGGIHSPDAVYQTLTFSEKLWDNIHHMLAPAICLTIGSFATLTMFTKNNILNETHQLYAVAARARGLSERKVLFKHILRNAFVPLVTGFPGSFLFMFFGGSLLIEKIFNLQGIGLLGYTAIMGRDYPVVMGDLFMFGALGLFARLLTDICYVIADPRISFEESKS